MHNIINFYDNQIHRIMNLHDYTIYLNKIYMFCQEQDYNIIEQLSVMHSFDTDYII